LFKITEKNFIMTETKRFKCSSCGEENPRRLHEEPDKTQVLYYSMQGAPVYKVRKNSLGM